MKTRTILQAFALFAVTIMVASSLASAAELGVVEHDVSTRATRLQTAVQALSRGDMSALPEARAAFNDAPAALRGSPAMSDIDQLLKTLDDPRVAQMMAPLLASGAFAGTPEELAARADKAQTTLEKVRSQIGLDTDVLKPQWDALIAATKDLNMSDPSRLEDQLRAMPPEKLDAIVANLAAFTDAWNKTSGTPLAARMDAIAKQVLARPTSDVQGAGELDAATFAQYKETVSIFDQMQQELRPETLLNITPEAAAYDEKAWQSFRDTAKANLTAAFEEMNLSDDAFLGDPLADQPSFPDAPTGPVAIDGQVVPGAVLPSTTVPAPLAPAVSAQLPADLAVLNAPTAPLTPPASTISHADEANALGLPGASNEPFPQSDYDNANDAETFGDAPSNATDPTNSAPLIFPTTQDYRGTLNATDTADTFEVQLPSGYLDRLFLQVPPGTNADLSLVCRSNNAEWSSASDAASDRPYFDSITFVSNTPGGADNEAFTRLPDMTGARCPGDDYDLTIYAPVSDPPTGEVKWLLRGSETPFSEKSCSESEWATCGLDWARWGDRCKDADTHCTSKHPSLPNDRNYTTQLAAGHEQPVVFIHGVGPLAYNTFVDMESHYYSKVFSIDGVTLIKLTVLLVGSALLGFGTASFMMCAQNIALMFAAGPSLLGALVGLTVFSLALAGWSSLLTSIFKFFATVFTHWRQDSWDEDSHFWNTRAAGFETYWIEYNDGDNNAMEARKHIQRAGWQIKYGINAIQQDFYDRHHKDPGFPYASPEDVKVDLVVHSMGGLTSRFYTVVPGVDAAGNYQADVAEGHSYHSNLYEADVNKWISIQTPNMGSSVAKHSLDKALSGPTVDDLLLMVFGFALNSCFGIGGTGTTWPLIKLFAKFAFNQVFLPLHSLSDLGKRDQLIPGMTPVVDLINAYPPAPDIDYGIIYGIPFPGFMLGIEPFDMLVAKNDALGPPALLARMATFPVYDDHASALFSGPVRDKLHEWLSAPDSNPPAPIPENAHAADGLPADAARLVTAATTPPRLTLLQRYGQVDASALDTLPGARYQPDGGALSTPAPVRSLEDLGGDRALMLERLAIERGFSNEARVFADSDGATRDAIVRAAADPQNASAIVGSQASSVGTSTTTNVHRDINTDAPDIAILRSVHADDARSLAERIAEPSVLLSASAPQSQFDARSIVIAPTGSLSGADASIATSLDHFVANGGTLIVLAQARGADLGVVPGAPQGFGFTEEDGAYRGSVVFGTFTPALAGQNATTPDVSVDGSFTKLPTDATIMLRSAKNARPVLAEYAWGNGHVIVSSLLSDWARASGRGTSDDTVLLRDLIADARAPTAQSIGGPGAAFSVHVDLSALAGNATSATLVLVTDGAKEATRETFDLANGADIVWNVPAGITTARHYDVDAIFRDADGNMTLKVLDVAHVYASAYAANPDGFRPSFAPGALDVTSDTDRVETGAPFDFDLRVTNLQDADQTFTVGYWLPEHATLTGDAATYGAGAPRNGSPPAYDDNFQLRDTITVPANSVATLHKALDAALRSDTVTARLYGVDGAVLGEARRAFTAYTPTVQLNLTTDAAHYAPGDAITLTVVAHDTAAAANAGQRPADLTATLRDPTGAIVATQTGSVLIGPTEDTTTLALPLPANAPVGGYAIAVEARFGATRIASATTSARVPGAQLAASLALPASFAAGSATTVTYTLSDPGPQPVASTPFTVSLVDPQGVTEWTGSQAIALAPGASQPVSFAITPTATIPGNYRLTYAATVDGVGFAGETPIRAGASATVTTSQASYRARDAFAASVLAKNDGLFIVPVTLEAVAPGIDDQTTSATLAPGDATSLALAGVVPADITAGQHPVTAALTYPNGATTTTRSFSVAPASVSLAMPQAASAAAGDTIAATLTNRGGVDASAHWAARLADASGRVVAVASDATPILAGQSASIGLTVPTQAASGSYRFTLSVDTGAQRATTSTKTIDISGVSGAIALTAPATVAPGGDISLSATPTSTGAPLSGASIELTAIKPTPLPAWVPVNSSATNAIAEFGGARWLGTNDGLLRVDDRTGAVTVITTSDGLPSNKIAALAPARGTLFVGTDRGLAWLDGASWDSLTNLAPLATKNVRALAGNANEVYISTDLGVARFDGSTVALLSLPTQAARSIAADDSSVWASLVDVTNGFAATDVQPIVKSGTIVANPSVAVTPDGDVHVIYVDNHTGSTNAQLMHVHLSADGQLISGPHVIRNNTNSIALTGLTADSQGDLHAVWEDYRVTGDADVYYRKIGPDGALLSDEIAVGHAQGSAQRWARVVDGPNDVIYIAWADDRDPNPPGASTPHGSEIYFAKMNEDGTPLLEQTRLTYSSGNVLIPRIAVDAQGNIHASYTDRVTRCDPEFPDICYPNLESFYAEWDPNGQQLVAPKVVSTVDDTISYLPSIAVEPNGDSDIVYQELGSPGGMYFSRLDAQGNFLEQAERLTSTGVVRPQITARADGLFDIVWTDYHTGKSEAWHNILDPVSGALTLAKPERINSPPLPTDGSQVVNGFALSVTSTPSGRTYAAWDDQRDPSHPQWRVAFTATRYTGRGAARIDLNDGRTTTFTRASGALPSDDVLGVAVEGDVAALTTPGALSLRDARTGSIDTVSVPGASGAVALHAGRAIVATSGRGAIVDPDTLAVAPIDGGGPLPGSLFATSDGVLVAGSDGAALLRDDREDRFGTTVVDATPDVASTGHISAPAEQGRYRVRATLLSATGQTLAVDERDVHVVDGTLAITIEPAKALVAPGENDDITVTVGDRGTTALRAVRTTLDAGSARLLDTTIDLAAGEARSFTVTRAAFASYGLVAVASGTPASLTSSTTQLTSSAADHVDVAAPQLTARILAPAVATRAPTPVDVLLANGGALPLALHVALDGQATDVTVPAHARVVVPALETVTVLDDTTLHLAVTGGATLALDQRVAAGERVAMTSASGLAGRAGARVVTLTFASLGSLATTFPLALTLDGGPLASSELSLAPGASLQHDIDLDLANGLHTLAWATPWASGSVRLVAADAAVPVLTLDAAQVQGGVASAGAHLENAGPGRLLGSLDVDFGFSVSSFPIDLAEGARFDAVATAPIGRAAPGSASAHATLVRDGASAAEATSAFVVPGPVIRFDRTPGDLDVAAGQALTLTYEVENIGQTTGPSDVAVAIAGADSLTKTVTLAPGEHANVSFETRIEADARDSTLAVVATAPGANDTSALRIAGAKVTATAAPDAALYASGAPANVVVNATNLGATPVDITLLATMGDQSAQTAATLAAGETRAIALPLVARVTGEAAWSVALASGRVLAQGAVPIAIDTLADSGIRVSADRDTVAAGGLVTLSFTTAQDGRVDIAGPGFRDAFELNGTQERTYLVPDTVRASRYTMLYTFDASNASGTLPLAVSGQEIDSIAFGLADGNGAPLTLASPGAVAHATWTIRAATAGNASLHVWLADEAGGTASAATFTVALAAGLNAIPYDINVTGIEPGAARAFATLALPGAASDDTLASAAASFAVRGFSLRDARLDDGESADLALHLEMTATPAQVAAIDVRVPGIGRVTESVPVDGALDHVIPFVAPEPGTYSVLVNVTSGSQTFMRSLTADVPGAGAPPVTTLAIDGATFPRANGVLVLSPAARVSVSATDDASGVAATYATDDDGSALPASGHLAAGYHNMTYYSADFAGHQEAARTLALLVDGDAPALTLDHPTKGEVHIAGALVAQAPGVTIAVSRSLLPAIPPRAVDSDGDGYTDAEEIVDGSNASDPASTPSRYMPPPAPSFETPIIALGAVQVDASAVDDGAGVARIAALLDGVEIASTTASVANWSLDLSHEAAGDHELTIATVDHVGNARSATFRVELVPTAPDGLAATDPTAPRLHPFVPETALWLQTVGAQLPGALAAEAAAKQARVDQLHQQTQRDIIDPNTPPVVTGLPDQLQRDVDATTTAVQQILDCCVTGSG